MGGPPEGSTNSPRGRVLATPNLLGRAQAGVFGLQDLESSRSLPVQGMSARPLLLGTLATLLLLFQVCSQGLLICQEADGDSVLEVAFSACCTVDGRLDQGGPIQVSRSTDRNGCGDCVDTTFSADWLPRSARVAEDLSSHDPSPVPCAEAWHFSGVESSPFPARLRLADPARLSIALRIAASTVMRC